jgi:hypothetical protein
LYLPKTATAKFFDNYITIKGVRMDLFNFNFLSGILEVQSKIEKSLELNGGYNYWLEFKKVEQGIKIDVLDFKSSDSFFSS